MTSLTLNNKLINNFCRPCSLLLSNPKTYEVKRLRTQVEGTTFPFSGRQEYRSSKTTIYRWELLMSISAGASQEIVGPRKRQSNYALHHVSIVCSHIDNMALNQSVCEKLLNQSVKEKGYFLNRNCKVSNLKMLLVSRFFSAECGSRDSIGN